MPSPLRLRPLIIALGCITALSGASIASADTLPAKVSPAPVSKPRPPLNSAQLLYQMLLSEIAYARGNLTEALSGYSDLSQRSDDPLISSRANEIATTSILMNAQSNPIEAEAAIRTALVRQSTARGPLLTQLSTIFARTADKAVVAQIVERLTAPWLTLPEAHLARAQAAMDNQQLPAAHSEAAEALRIQPDSEPAALLLAQSASAEQSKTEMEALGKFGQEHPQAIDARLNYTRWLSLEKRNAEATSQYQKLLAEYPDSDPLAFAIIGIAAQTNDLATSEKLLGQLIQHGWGDIERHRLLLGEVQEERGKTAEALSAYDAVRPGLQFVPAQVHRAILLQKLGQFDAALKSLHEASARDPEALAELQLAEVQLLRQAGKLQTAHELLQTILTREPDNQDALYDGAMLAEQIGQPTLMEQRLRHLIELKPDHAHALNALGYSFADRNIRLDEAQSLLERAIKLAPEDAAIIDSAGWLYFRQGKSEMALSFLRRAYDLFPDPEVAGHLIEVLWATGQPEPARKIMQDALQSSPGNVALKTLAARLGL